MTEQPEPLRRRAPGWVRAWSSQTLHAVALRFQHDQREADLSAQQEWLFDQVVNELEYRRRRATRTAPLTACSCALCLPPFEAD